MSCRAFILLGSVLPLAFAASASASITLGTNAQRPALRVDGRGNAEVSWTAGGVRRYVFVPPTGRVYPGRRLTAADISRRSAAVALPFRRVLRRTPDGRLWALQTWRVRPGGPVELRFSRWRGEPPKVTVGKLRGRAQRPCRPSCPYLIGRSWSTIVFEEGRTPRARPLSW